MNDKKITVDSIQQIINDKANRECNDKAMILLGTIRELLPDAVGKLLKVTYPDGKGGHSTRAMDEYFKYDYGFTNLYLKTMLNKQIVIENKAFIERVEALENDVNDLMDRVDNQ